MSAVDLKENGNPAIILEDNHVENQSKKNNDEHENMEIKEELLLQEPGSPIANSLVQLESESVETIKNNGEFANSLVQLESKSDETIKNNGEVANSLVQLESESVETIKSNGEADSNKNENEAIISGEIQIESDIIAGEMISEQIQFEGNNADSNSGDDHNHMENKTPTKDKPYKEENKTENNYSVDSIDEANRLEGAESEDKINETATAHREVPETGTFPPEQEQESVQPVESKAHDNDIVADSSVNVAEAEPVSVANTNGNHEIITQKVSNIQLETKTSGNGTTVTGTSTTKTVVKKTKSATGTTGSTSATRPKTPISPVKAKTNGTNSKANKTMPASTTVRAPIAKKPTTPNAPKPTTPTAASGTPTTPVKGTSSSSALGSPTSRPSTRRASAPTTPADDTTAAKKLPMNKIKVGTVAPPNLKEVKSKIGSLAASGKSYKPGGGHVEIPKKKLAWNAESKIGSLSNVKYVPAGSKVKVPSTTTKVESKKVEVKDVPSKVGSFANVNYKPGGGDKKILKIAASNSNTGSGSENGSASVTPRPPSNSENNQVSSSSATTVTSPPPEANSENLVDF